MPDAVPNVAQIEALAITGGVFGAVGLVLGTRVIVDWMKLLLNISGQRVRYLTTIVAAYAVATLALVTVAPVLAVVFAGVYAVCLIATLLDAQHHQAQAIQAEQMKRIIEERVDSRKDA